MTTSDIHPSSFIPHPSALPIPLRNQLERAIIQARDIAETGSRSALEALAVHHHEPYDHMTTDELTLRNKLRAHALQIGDPINRANGVQAIDRLVIECAYEQWHRIIFARYLAENHLLIEPESGVAISLAECGELARDEGLDPWALAGRYAQAMLRQIFRPDDPLLQVKLARNHQLPLEDLLKNLDTSVFTASDSLGWVYQFWQSKKKEEVNASGVKIGERELPAVTQLFTEPYMVSFLIHNTLGAWWAGKRMGDEGGRMKAEREEEARKACSLPGMTLEYLRFIQDADGCWTPAAGIFEEWPAKAAELKILDPCCGSGHFLVALLNHLAPLRMAEEGLSARNAVDAALRENIYGLELDQRCVELAAFALAMAAWKYPGAGGYRTLPKLNVACSGLSVSVTRSEWVKLANGDSKLRTALVGLYEEFKNAPVLGSLIDPVRTAVAKLVEWDGLAKSVETALQKDRADEEREAGVTAQGLAKAAQILAGKYHLVITNVPYLARGKQHETLRDFCEKNYPEAKNDLATVFLERCLELCAEEASSRSKRPDGASTCGAVSVVLPQNWLFLTSYKKFREKLLKNDTWHLIARLGPGAFETISGEVVKAILITLSRGGMGKDEAGRMKDEKFIRGMDVSEPRTVAEKADGLLTAEIKSVEQAKQLENPGIKVSLDNLDTESTLSECASVHYGSKPGQTARVTRQYWELPTFDNKLWVFMESSPIGTGMISGKTEICYSLDAINVYRIDAFGVRGSEAWKKEGIILSKMSNLPYSVYLGEFFDDNTCVITPNISRAASAIFCSMEENAFQDSVRLINQKVSVTKETLEATPFDLDHWTQVAAEKYPHGLPEPYSDDPTQWIFHGHPCGSVVWSDETKRLEHGPLRKDATVLQVAVARLLGYRWPAELNPQITQMNADKENKEKNLRQSAPSADKSLELCDESRHWVRQCEALWPYADTDGIVCIPSVRGEDAAPERLREILAAAYGDGQIPSAFRLPPSSSINTADLDDWLRNQFFEAHCKLFHHRPFIWHIWDGRKRDGFHALVNYHKLSEGNGKGRQLLEKLTYGYLGDWIIIQKDGVKQGTGGAEDRLTAATELEKRLKAILAGEPPFDIFVRWKPLSQQPIGWEPDINDGVRLNIRPFLAPDHPVYGSGADIPGGKKGAGILRWKPNINWNKDRGNDVSSAPWYGLGPQYGGNKGDRINDHHLTVAEKMQARETAMVKK